MYELDCNYLKQKTVIRISEQLLSLFYFLILFSKIKNHTFHNLLDLRF